MHFSEDDLRSALRRKTPSEDFTGKVLSQIGRLEIQDAQVVRQPVRSGLKFWPWSFRWATAGALAASLLVGIGAFQYHRYQMRQDVKRQAVLAVQITKAKLDGALRQALYLRRDSE
jgi:hypothetical protein